MCRFPLKILVFLVYVDVCPLICLFSCVHMEFPDVSLPAMSYKSAMSLSTIFPICFVEGAKGMNKYLHSFKAYKKINPHHVRTGLEFKIEGTIRNASERFKMHGNLTLLGMHGSQCLRAHENQCLGM